MLNAVRIWILFSTLLVASGWILSALRQLNRAGYGIIFALALGAFFYWRQTAKRPPHKNLRQSFHRFWKRFKRPAPLLFLALAAMTLAGGALYLPANGDSNAYRIPRVLHWLGAEQWHWIHTSDTRMNIAGCGFEWLSTPLILFTRTDRFLFLINWISFLLLPGLIFSVFTRLQVRPRAAWWWMWLLASGWCFVFQAESNVNDSFATIYALAAVDLALRARESKSVADLWLSILAAGLLTGTKQTSIPLALLWLIAVWPAVRQMFSIPKRTLGTLAVAVLGLLVSAVPLIVLNLVHTGNWMGISRPEIKTLSWGGWSNTVLDSPFWGIIGNTFCIAAQNLKPPLFPMADFWNTAMQHFLRTPPGAHFTSFEHFGLLDQGMNASSAGIGLGICLITGISLWAAHRLKRIMPGEKIVKPGGLILLLRIAPWGLLLLFMAKVGTYENARQLAPYYVFFFPSLIAGQGHELVVRRIWWQRLVYLIFLSTAMLLVISRTNPLFPAQTLFGWLHEKYPGSKAVQHLSVSYSTQLTLQTVRNSFRNDLPAGGTVIGYYVDTAGSAEPGLWLPLDSRRVMRVLPDDTAGQLRALQIHYVVVDEFTLNLFHETLDQWLLHYDAEVVKQVVFTIKFGMTPQHLYLVRLREEPARDRN